MQRSGASLALAAGLIFASVIPLALAQSAAPSPAPADLILEGGRIYTVDAGQPVAEAVAVRAGRVVLVGTKRDARRLQGPRTQLVELGGHMLLPGLIDAHIHPVDIIDLDVCDLDSQPHTLAELSAFVARSTMRSPHSMRRAPIWLIRCSARVCAVAPSS
jgi:hypothetical protein